jgi:hypothetical protein
VYQLGRLKRKMKSYQDNNTYVYTDVFKTWVNEFNTIMVEYNRNFDGRILSYEIQNRDFSGTGKTIKPYAVDAFESEIEESIKRFQAELENIKKEQKQKQIPVHQMRKCFKTGVDSCSVNPVYDKNKAFIAMPFDEAYTDAYEYGIKLALKNLGMTYYRADSDVANVDIMCKICREIQSCRVVIANISSLNPNVMLELGLAYGIGKNVMIIKDKNTKNISDLGCIEYIGYSHAYELMCQLTKALQ